MTEMTEAELAASQLDCQDCGACCVYSEEWPRFSMETDAELDLIPEAFVATDLGGMKCENDRCTALSGTPGQRVACTVYAVRPIVCRTCMPGDVECLMAREKLFGAAA